VIHRVGATQQKHASGMKDQLASGCDPQRMKPAGNNKAREFGLFRPLSWGMRMAILA
jgi:hypothetical protein